ncbi:CU044_2847 family protein [Paraflavitalea sp. CAU 1676]|uniref:CU044_2847 family protein n=1 Tax=Paraflavitalea sp. CAU 1676 TaxID=3032598 RepID=UPI0023DC4D32|nr:CU044_2847 family protein [Paraflavitalea sp. CAU 1676]MDF2188286.1 CU044_2847 family protein [Paraflavitalea sp. CAU 1676]
MNDRNTEVVTVVLDNGEEFLMEVTATDGREKVADLGVISMSDLTRSIRSISTTIVDTLKEISPDKFAVEFGVEASIKSGKLLALLCNADGKANLKITLEWTKKTKE